MPASAPHLSSKPKEVREQPGPQTEGKSSEDGHEDDTGRTSSDERDHHERGAEDPAKRNADAQLRAIAFDGVRIPKEESPVA